MGSPADPARRLASEDGFALVEVLAAAVLLVVVALASLSVFDAAAKTSGASKARSIAANIAEQDQERMKGMTAPELSNYHEERDVAPGGTATYTVSSRAEWIRDAGGVESCTTSDSQADYMRITSTVEAGILNKPVTTATIIAPPVGSFGDDVGTLTVKVLNRDSNPVAGVSVAISGATSLSDTTNSLGCAVFSHIPAGAYTATSSAPGYVDSDGNSPGTVSGTVTADKVTVLSETFDKAATINGTFLTYRNTWAGTAGWVNSSARSFTTNGPIGTDVVKNAAWQSTMSISGLYPFTAGYGTYSGSCASAAPPAGHHTTYPDTFVAPASGGTAAAVARHPSLAVRVIFLGTPVANAHVVATPTGTGCATGDKVSDLTTTSGGYVSKSAGTYDAGMPFGTYTVCADALVGTPVPVRRSAQITYANTNFTVATPTTITLTTGAAVLPCS